MSITARSVDLKSRATESKTVHSPDIINCHSHSQEEDMSEYQGDRLTFIKRDQLRIGFVNIDGVPAINNDSKNNKIKLPD